MSGEYDMGLMDEIKKVAHSVGDTISEATHKVHAQSEHASREAAGGSLTPGEKIGSLAREGKEDVLGAVDHAKRDLRSDV